MNKKYKAEVIALMEQAYRQGYRDSRMDTGNPGLQSMSAVEFADYLTKKSKLVIEFMTQTTFTGD